MKNILIFMLCGFFVSCSSLPRQYDGNVGYKISNQKADVMIVNNIQEHARVSEDVESKKILNLCARELSVPTANIQIVQQKREVVQTRIPMTTPVVTGMSVSKADNGSIVSDASTLNVENLRQVKLRKTQFECKRIR